MKRLAAVCAAVVCAMFTFNSAAAGASPASQHPVVLSAQATPSALGANGGVVTVTGKVRDASTWSLAVLRDDHITVSRPKPASCANGTYSERVRFGPDKGASGVVVRLSLTAGSARGAFYVSVASTAHHPMVLSARATPWQLSSKGATITIEGEVKNAKVCRLATLADHGVALRLVLGKDTKTQISKPIPCANGTYREKLMVGNNPFGRRDAVELGLFPDGLVRKYAGVFFVSLDGKAKLAATTTASATVATTTPTTSAPPVTSALTTGLVPLGPLGPLPLPPTGTTTTTTTVAPTTTTTVAPTTTTLTSTTTTVNPNQYVQQATSANWSGYVMTGSQQYSHVQGTFTVPSLTTGETCNSFMAEWVGIDGYNNQDLIQAGVNESATNPTTGTCNGPNTFFTSVWWEILPSYESEVLIPTWNDGSSASVKPGDQVTVTIGQVSNSHCPSGTSECWGIEVTDDTTGESFITDQPYNGPGASAEWIVEDIDQATNPACTTNPNPPPYECPMPNYTPSVQFTGLDITPSTYSNLYSESLVQNGLAVSTPSTLATNYDFSVSYTGGTQGAPEGSGGRLPITSHPLGSVVPNRGGGGGRSFPTKT